jgi:hypothetical protein
MYCNSTTLVKWEESSRTATALRCRSWLCPDCSPQRQRQLVAEVLSGSPTVFLTLTVRRVEGEAARDAAARLIGAWRRARREHMVKHKLKKLPFYAVVEATKLGWPHLHIMLRNCWIDQRWLSARMDAMINSPIVDIRKIDNRGRAAGYVSKYAAKATHKFGTCKRYWCSRDYKLKDENAPVLEPKRKGGYERESNTIQHIVNNWQRLGWQVTWFSKWRAKAIVNPT